MSEKKTCRRCERGIDAYAKICPYCNWDQTIETEPPPRVIPAAVAEYQPPSELAKLKRRAIYAAVGVVMLIAAFGVGYIINKDDAPKHAPDTIEEQIAEEKAAAGPVRRANTPLVPTNEPGGIEHPITSAPVAAQPGATPNDWQRTDATAVSAEDYAEMAKRARAEKARMATLVDPRSLTGPAYAQSQRPVTRRPGLPGQSAAQNEPAGEPAPRPARRISMRTRPVPQHQPLPEIHGRGTARLSLLIGADGRVKRIDVERTFGGNTARLVDAVQNWRFKPATENGEPIAAPYSVEISFR
jgi:hypothetical protein